MDTSSPDQPAASGQGTAGTPRASARTAHQSQPAPTDFERLVALLRPERADILVVFALAVVIGLLLLATPIAVQAIVNSVALGGQIQPLVTVALVLMLMLGLAAVLYCAQTWTVELLQRRLFVRFVADLLARLPRVSFAAYDRGHGPEVVNRFFDILTIQKAAPKLLIDALGMLLGVVVGLTVLAFYHPLLLAFDALLLVSIAVIVLGPRRRGERTAISESSVKYEIAGWLEEVARSPHTFRSGGAEQWILERADDLTRRWVDVRQLHFRTLFRQIRAAVALQVIAGSALLGVGGWLVIKGSLTLGQLVAAELIVSAVTISVAKIGKYLETWYDLMAAVHKVGQLLDLEVERTGTEAMEPGTASGLGLQFSNVSVEGPRGSQLLANVSLDIKPGERIGITGPTGSGKSALIELLWRLREPTTGTVRAEGCDLRDLVADSLRSGIGIVSQVETVHGTVRENVSLRRPSVSASDVRDAIECVQLTETIAELPDGLDTVLHPHGRKLSEGEAQQLMLARAIAGAPSLLAVDSLFDGSPPKTRTAMFDLLLDKTRPWTLVVVSSRSEVLERCDRVLYLTPGGGAEVRTSHSSTRTEDQ